MDQLAWPYPGGWSTGWLWDTQDQVTVTVPRRAGANLRAGTGSGWSGLSWAVRDAAEVPGDVQVRAAGVDGEAASLLLAGAGEVITNALVHGPAPRRVWVYTDGPALVCHVRDWPGLRRSARHLPGAGPAR